LKKEEEEQKRNKGDGILGKKNHEDGRENYKGFTGSKEEEITLRQAISVKAGDHTHPKLKTTTINPGNS